MALFGGLYCSHIVPVWGVCLNNSLLSVLSSFGLALFGLDNLEGLDWPLQLDSFLKLDVFLLNHQALCGFACLLGLDCFLSGFVITQDLFDIVLDIQVDYLVRNSSQSLDVQGDSFGGQVLQSFEQLLEDLVRLLGSYFQILFNVADYFHEYLCYFLVYSGILGHGHYLKDRVDDRHKVRVQLPVFLLVLDHFLQQLTYLVSLHHLIILLEEL